MRVYTLISQKGGAAKSTTTCNLAVAAVESGKKTLIIDCDPQRTSTKWWERRSVDETKPALIHVETAEVEKAVRDASQLSFEQVIIDTPGHAGLAGNAAASAATMCIVPCQPSICDIESTVDTARMLSNTDAKYCFLLTRCPSVGGDKRETADFLSALGLVCQPVMHERKAFKRAHANGLGVIEHARNDRDAESAAQEVRDAYMWLTNREDRLSNTGAALTGRDIGHSEEAVA